MIPYLGDFVEDDVVYMMLNTFTSDDPSASCTITNLLDTDIHVHKDDGLTQRNPTGDGITVSVNFDGITGSHMIKIDTNNNTHAGFWIAGHDYFVRIEGTTIDGATINAVVGHFSIENRFMRGTDSAALAATALTNVTWTDAKAGHLDAPISTVDAVVDGIQADLSNAADGLGALKALIDAVDGVVDTILIDTNDLQTNQGAWATAAGFSTHSAADVKTAIEAGGSSIASILADTGELQTDWVNGGRLDILIDAILLDTGTTLNDLVERILGMSQENFFIDNTTYTDGYMTGARIRIYSVAGSVGTASDVIATHTVTATYAGSEMTDYKVVKS